MSVEPRDIIKRLEAATGPDRELDIAIAVNLLGFTVRNRMERWPDKEPIFEYTDPATNSTGAEFVMVREYTASLDAVLALVEAKLPGWQFDIHGSRDAASVLLYAASVLLYEPGIPFRDVPKGQSGVQMRPICIALLIALFKALEASNG